MSYEEIDKSAYGTDVFTNGAKGRYAKPKLPTADDTPEAPVKKKRAPKAPSASADASTEQANSNGHTDEVVKTKKKSRKAHDDGGTANGDETSPPVPDADTEAAVKPKKKRAPKVDMNNENIDPTPVTEEPVKKKKSKAPKATPVEDDYAKMDSTSINDLEATPKVKKSKKSKKSKISADAFDETPIDDSNEYTTNQDSNGIYTADGASYDMSPADGEQVVTESERSEYETAITDAYNNLQSQINFAEFFPDDKWGVIHLPKSARGESKVARIRKILPGGKDDKTDAKPATQKGGFFKRIRSGVTTLVRDETNLIFGDPATHDIAYFDEEEDGVDTDDLHRYAQKLRELEDNDREINPEFLVLRDGKTVYGVHEADGEGKMKLSTRKPIYDRHGDQKPDEPSEKKKLLARLRHPFTRNKDKDGKDGDSPKPSNGTPDPSGKRSSRKSTNKTADDDMATLANSEPLLD